MITRGDNVIKSPPQSAIRSEQYCRFTGVICHRAIDRSIGDACQSSGARPPSLVKYSLERRRSGLPLRVISRAISAQIIWLSARPIMQDIRVHKCYYRGGYDSNSLVRNFDQPSRSSDRDLSPWHPSLLFSRSTDSSSPIAISDAS